MNDTIINIKTNADIKERAQAVAQELGLSLSAIINAYLRQIIRTKTVSFSASDEEPTEYLLEMLRQSKNDIKNKKISPAFSDSSDALKWLNRS